MKLDISPSPSVDFRADAKLIKQGESLGFDCAWTTECSRNPFFALSIAAKDTKTIRLGARAAAFLRSPMVTAQIAWDLARQSGGRFTLGLDAELREDLEVSEGESAQIEVARMREYIESLRAIWDTFQTDARLRYRGQYYTFRLMAPFFNPGSIDHPDIPIFLAGGNPAIWKLAGELCQGLLATPLHTTAYLNSALLPALSSGLTCSGRGRRDVEIAASVFVVSGTGDGEFQRAKSEAKRQIAYLATSPANHDIVEHLGLEETAETLQRMAASKRWEQMTDAVTDCALSEIAIVAQPQDILGSIRERYSGLADRVCPIVNSRNSRIINWIMSA